MGSKRYPRVTVRPVLGTSFQIDGQPYTVTAVAHDRIDMMAECRSCGEPFVLYAKPPLQLVPVTVSRRCPACVQPEPPNDKP